MSVSGKPLQPSFDERLTRLTRAFIEVVETMLEAGESWADISVERLIKAVDISRSTYYVYYQDKGELLRAITAGITADLATAGTAWFELRDDAERDDLREALRNIFDTYRHHRAILGAVSEAAAYDAGVREQQVAIVETAVAGLANHIAERQARGTAAPELHPERTARWLTWMLERGLYQLVAPADDASADEYLETVSDIAWRTLYEGFQGS